MKVRITKRKAEREAAMGAMGVLGALTAASAPSDHILFVLRSAANVATTATYQRIESRQSLNELRSHAAKSLNVVCRLIELRRLDQTSIDEGKAAVQAWLAALSAEDCR